MTLKHTESDLSAALAKGREKALEEAAKLCADWAPEVHRLPATVPGDYAAGWEDACRNCEREIRALPLEAEGEDTPHG